MKGSKDWCNVFASLFLSIKNLAAAFSANSRKKCAAAVESGRDKSLDDLF